MAEKYIDSLAKSIFMQEDVDIAEVIFVLTDTGGKEREIIEPWKEKDNRIQLEVIKKSEFSHSLNREKAARKAKGDILVFIKKV